MAVCLGRNSLQSTVEASVGCVPDAIEKDVCYANGSKDLRIAKLASKVDVDEEVAESDCVREAGGY